MKFTVRDSVFETNSSSVHALIVSPDTMRDYPATLTFTTNDFGWETELYNTCFERAAYLWTYVTSSCHNDNERLAQYRDVLIDVCERNGVDVEFSRNEDGYIDHSGELSSFVKEIFDDTDLLEAFLFGDGSAVCTGNDNTTYDYNRSAGEDIVDGIIRACDAEVLEGSYIYEKGN